MANGYWGKMLEVNMTTGEMTVTERHMQYVDECIGGGPLASKMVWEALKDNPGCDPMGPDNVLIIMPGPLSGSGFPGASSRYISYCKSPVTQAKSSPYGENGGTVGFGTSGGRFAQALKMTGFDCVYITGQSATPKYLVIRNEEYQLVDAEDVMDMTTAEFEEEAQKRHGDDMRVISVGPAGMHGVRYSALITECGRAAGRGGTGAVMGSKGLKGIVAYGDRAVPTAMTNMQEKFDEYWNKAISMPGTMTNRKGGTIYVLTTNSLSGLLCTKNHREGTNPYDAEIGANAIFSNFIVKSRSCYGCPHYCMKCGILKDGPYKGCVVDGPDYEFGMNGSNWLLNNLDDYMKVVQVVEDLGFDNLGCGSLVSFVLEAYEKGVITADMLDGIKMEWGNGTEILKFLDKLCFGEGEMWDWLRRGGTYTAWKLTERYGTEGLDECVCETKNAAWAAHGLQAQANEGRIVAYAFASQGASHTFGRSVSGMNQNMGTNAGVTCNRGANTPYGADGVADMLSCVTGKTLTGADLVALGEKTINRDAVFNFLNGFRKEDNDIHEIAFTPITWGPKAGAAVDRDWWENEIRPTFIEGRGWDLDTEYPTAGKLQEIGLNDCVPYLNSVLETL